MTLSEMTPADIKLLAEAIVKEMHPTCKLDPEERYFINEAKRHISILHLPLLGKVLRILDDAATWIGRFVILGILSVGIFLAIKLNIKL